MIGHPLAPYRRKPGHPGRCRNEHGTTWEGCCNAAQHPRHTVTQPTLDLGAAT